MKGYFTRNLCEGIRFKRIASTAGVYTQRFPIKETLPLIEEMLVGKSPKPSSFMKGRNAYGKQNATKSDTLLRLRR